MRSVAPARAAHVDHDHDTGKVRGITCFPCNGGMGQFKENVEWLANAIAYLERHGDAWKPRQDLMGPLQFHNEPKSSAEEWVRRLMASTAVS